MKINYLLGVLLCIFLSGNVFAESILSDEPYTVKYDKFEDRTSVTKTIKLSQSFDDLLLLTLIHISPGKNIEPPKFIAVNFTDFSESWNYLENKSVTFLFDGLKFSLEKAVRLNQNISSSGGVQESLTTIVPVGVFTRIANAQSVDVRLGYGTDFTLNEEVKGQLRQFLSSFQEPQETFSN